MRLELRMIGCLLVAFVGMMTAILWTEHVFVGCMAVWIAGSIFGQSAEKLED